MDSKFMLVAESLSSFHCQPLPGLLECPYDTAAGLSQNKAGASVPPLTLPQRLVTHFLILLLIVWTLTSILQYNFDTNHLELMQTPPPKSKDMTPKKTALTLDVSCILKEPQDTSTSDQLAADSGIPMTLYFCIVSWSGVVLLLLSGHLPCWNVDVSSLYFASMTWTGKAALLFAAHSNSAQKSPGVESFRQILLEEKRLTYIFSCSLLNQKDISKAEGWCLVWNRCFDGDICEFFTFCSKQEDWI